MHIMEEIMKKKKELCLKNTSPSPAATQLGVQRHSQTISKIKPKIRIIHLYAPEIIKTDAANFRELVQRLTGKPTKSKKNSRKMPTNNLDNVYSSAAAGSIFPYKTQKMEVIRGGLNHFPERMIKGEEQIWSGPDSGGRFLGGFAEIEGFMDQHNHELPSLPVAYGETQLAYTTN